MKVVHPRKPGQAVGCHTHHLDRETSRINLHKNARRRRKVDYAADDRDLVAKSSARSDDRLFRRGAQATRCAASPI